MVICFLRDRVQLVGEILMLFGAPTVAFGEVLA
ncbi:hypothetical protein SAMN05444422_111100 [Halobiforma haloterrestris]|uniref:Uncharacterized protein n=1 Tax=Natronobacterium haloterrestre TaxID=148448 RepID=A0A1I1KG33_NATHA|nr:hypothetical protein SAMN05444422_111100 [Halobiforma haloterrestris]